MLIYDKSFSILTNLIVILFEFFPMNFHENKRKRFAITLIVVEAVIIIIYGIFVRPLSFNENSNLTDAYPIYQNLNAIVLIGFGFSMAFIKNHSWSSISYTFFINAVVVQLYILWDAFWRKIFNFTSDYNVNVE